MTAMGSGAEIRSTKSHLALFTLLEELVDDVEARCCSMSAWMLLQRTRREALAR